MLKSRTYTGTARSLAGRFTSSSIHYFRAGGQPRPGVSGVCFMPPTGIGITHPYPPLLDPATTLPKIWKLLYMNRFQLLKITVFYLVAQLVSVVLSISLSPISAVTRESVTNFAVIFFLWNVIYFGFSVFWKLQALRKSTRCVIWPWAANRNSTTWKPSNPHFILIVPTVSAHWLTKILKSKRGRDTTFQYFAKHAFNWQSREIPLREEPKLVERFSEPRKIRYESGWVTSSIYRTSQAAALSHLIIQSQGWKRHKHGISVSIQPGLLLLTHTTGEFLMIHCFKHR